MDETYSKRPNRLFYTVKLLSSDIKSSSYHYNSTFQKCLADRKIISLADSQMLKTIRYLTSHDIDLELLETYYSARDKAKSGKNNPENRRIIRESQEKIYNMMYIPEYITVVMDNPKHYDYLYHHGFYFNESLYTRFSCSASQARLSTVVFIKDSIKQDAKRMLDNGRSKAPKFTDPSEQSLWTRTPTGYSKNVDPPPSSFVNDPNTLLGFMCPSKYNAYFGLYSSAIQEVTKPRFCIVSDYESSESVDVDYVVEQGPNEDDIIEQRTISTKFNRFDGSGMISPQMAAQWGRDLHLDYTPCQFCIRYSFTKGMVNEFDFIQFCETEIPDSIISQHWEEWQDLLPEAESRYSREIFYEDIRYFIKDVYGKLIDLREIDTILSEGQCKIWNAWPSQSAFEQCCEENHIVFGVTRPAPKEDVKTLINNYQFVQTLDLDDEKIHALCKDTIDYIQGVSLDDHYYTLLYMLGTSITTSSISNYLRSSDNYWMKSLICEPSMMGDKYTKEKIREYIIRKIEQAALGKIIVKGNFQCIVPDNYAYMQHITGQPVIGLLRTGEAYSQFWNKEGATEIACARSPMTSRSEWTIHPLRNDEIVNKWYSYSYSGVIVPCTGHFTMNWGGSDFDFDIIASTNNPTILSSIFPNQRVITYNVPSPIKRNFTEDDLYNADIHTFGTAIGNLTNKSTICYALAPLFPESSPERALIESRIKACTAAQSRVIDRAKIGKEVKIYPPMWNTWQHIDPDDPNSALKNLQNSILCDKKPYFMRYKYDKLDKAIRSYQKQKEHDYGRNFHYTSETGKEIKPSLTEALSLPPSSLTPAQLAFIDKYYKFSEVINSDCTMNRICWYIESVDFQIKQKTRSSLTFNPMILASENPDNYSKDDYEKIKATVFATLSSWKETIRQASESKKAYERSGIKSDELYDESSVFNKDMAMKALSDSLYSICSNSEQLTNCMVRLFYIDRPSLNKGVLWGVCGKQIFKNVISRKDTIYVPEKNPNGELEYLYDKYFIVPLSLKEEQING